MVLQGENLMMRWDDYFILIINEFTLMYWKCLFTLVT